MTASVIAGYADKVSEYVAGRPEYPADLLADLAAGGDDHRSWRGHG
jgi:hypothetical protein